MKQLIGSMFLPADFYEGTLTVESIEGDSIYVEQILQELSNAPESYESTDTPKSEVNLPVNGSD
ncbi:hypothetical protein [Paenibacillus oceani]|uniref:Uncharacterized protein n=1 Tax=Paenibacillus oceani TaxID=2772510 RepID=A0A927CFT5_9BACL|nr:hypothetical protein [Paenibacillus oceani]MBD2864985.1 hypothetical protein [Paenibacillus oceani]